MGNYDRFTGLYPVSKTLRFELRPIGKTMEHVKKSNFLEQDAEIAEDYIVMKRLMDDYHRRFIDRSLKDSAIDWMPLAKVTSDSKSLKDAASKKQLEAEQKRVRSELIELVKSKQEFKSLFNEEMLSVLLKDEITSRNDPAEIKAFSTFNKFSTYFTGYHENRKNIYSNEDKHSSLAYRTVSENFPRHYNNCIKYEQIKKNMPEVLQLYRAENKDGNDLNAIFDVSNYGRLLTQDGIDEYNTVIGGIGEEDGMRRGLNVILTNYHQKSHTSDKIKLLPLYKQILSHSKTKSFVPRMFENDDEMKKSISDFIGRISDENILQRVAYLFWEIGEYDASKIYLNSKDIAFTSKELYDNWAVLGELMQQFKGESIGDPNLEKTRKKVDKWLSSKEFTLKDILDSIVLSGNGVSFNKYVEKIRTAIVNIDGCERTCLIPEIAVSGDDIMVANIKKLLDSYMTLLHLVKPFAAREELDLEPAFYSEYTELYEILSELIPLYNKVRNYLTKSKLSSIKIKMNFSNATLAAGWDLNKELNNNAVLFRRNGNYYLGVMNPKNKTDFRELASTGNEDSYQKMVYKFVPDPKKMLPKVFVKSKTGIKNYSPSKEILDRYEEKAHVAGETFSLEYCHTLIDYYKSCIAKHKDWQAFDFKFSDTGSYKNINDFYKEVSDQGYKVTFADIPVATIDKLVDDGNLYLFQMYNKDFSEHSKGARNLHTMYWDAAFSESNLRDVVIKINGEAELFFREKSDIKDIKVHRAGTILVNRISSDGNPIPNEIYYELFRYKTGQTSTLSEEAKSYLDSTKTKNAKYDIVKDRRFTEDRMYFHIPITLNFKSDGETKLNKIAIENALSSPDLRIIGIDRGERNLIYISVIDRSGNIIEQKSYNIMDGVDYHKKLDVRERERKDSLKSWTSVEKIADLKEGYISKAVHEISRLIIEHDAIVVMEDLNYGFKHSRTKIEKQIYQKFEKALIEKLNYLVFKDRGSSETGGVLRAYQLTEKMDSFKALGKQSGIIFYVPAAYTSNIDPTTGFVNLFNTAKNTTREARADFIKKMDSIKYNAGANAFDFAFDYRNFITSSTDYRNVWTVSTRGERIKYDNKKKNIQHVEPTRAIAGLLSSEKIDYADGSDLKLMICEGDYKFTDVLYYALMDALKMRNSEGIVDYIQSPVKNRNGQYFLSGKNDGEPKDADANGAYHIALKGELMLRMIDYDSEAAYVKLPNITNAEWLKFVQTREG